MSPNLQLSTCDQTSWDLACQGRRKKWTDFIGIFSLSSTILFCAAVFLLCCFKRPKKNNRLIQIVIKTLHKEKQQQRNYRYSKKLHLTETTLDEDEVSLPPEIHPQLRSRQQATPRAPATREMPGSTSRSLLPPDVKLH